MNKFMKKYMSRPQRVDFITYNSFLGFLLNKFYPDWVKRNYLSEEEQDKLGQSVKLMKEVASSVIARMDGDFKKVLEKDMNDLQIISLPKDKARLALDDYKKSTNLVEVDSDILDTFASVSLELCSRCFKSKEEQENCLLKECYMHVGIPVLDDEAEGCPYRDDTTNIKNEFLIDFLKRFFDEVKKRGNIIEMEHHGEEFGYSKETSKDCLR